jgi:hypothetical protein
MRASAVLAQWASAASDRPRVMERRSRRARPYARAANLESAQVM